MTPPLGDRAVRALQRGWTAGLVLALLFPLGAFVWTHVDRRPAWVMSVLALAESRDETRARDRERAAVAGVLRRIDRLRLGPAEVRGERERRTGNGLTFEWQRTIVVRNEREDRLSALERDSGSPDASATTPRRALRAQDSAFAFVLLAMLLSIATLEPSALRDADRFELRSPLVVLNLLAAGLLGAGAVVVVSGWNAALALTVAFTLGPTVVWLARANARWMSDQRLASRYVTVACLTGAVAAAWLARMALPG